MLQRVCKDPGMQDVPFLLFLNKNDLPEENKMLEELVLETLGVEALREMGRKIRIQKCSAKQGSGIWEGIG